MKTLLTFLFLVSVTPSFAQVKSDSMKPINIDDNLLPHADTSKYIVEPCYGVQPYKAYQQPAPWYLLMEHSYVFTRKELLSLPVSDINDIVSMLPAVYQQRRGADINISGARASGTLYVLDNMTLLR